MKNESNSSETDHLEASFIIERYRSLVEHASEHVFPSADHPPFIAIPDMTHMSNWRSALHKFTTPFTFFDNLEENRSAWLYWFWLLMFSGWLGMSYILFTGIFGTFPDTGRSEVIPWYSYITVGIYAASAFLGLGMYFHAITFLTNRMNSWKFRVIWLLGFLFSLVYLIFVLRHDYPDTFPSVLADPRYRNLFILTMMLFTSPLIIYFVTLIIVVIRFSVWLFGFLWDYFTSGNMPFTFMKVLKVIDSPIAGSEEEWRLLDLSERELRTIREWSRDNLEATEKRLVPTFWLLAIIALIANSQIFENWLGAWIKYFSYQYTIFEERDSIFAVTPDVFFIFIILVPIAATLILVTIRVYLAMFRNIAIQVMIIDSCTVSLYAVEQREESSRSKAIQDKERRFNLWKILFG